MQIGPLALAERLKAKENMAILDVREDWETERCKIQGSLHIALNELPQRVQELSKDVPLVVLCHHGMRSLRAVIWLRGQGYDNAVNLEGGIDGWARQVDRGMGTY